MPFPNLTLVLGGASSGKSDFAEQMVVGTGKPRTYIATAQAFDAEMKAKIARHQTDREQGWTTIEAPLDLVTALAEVPAEGIILIDCLTLWLSNQMLAEADIDAETARLLTALISTQTPIVCVSNEVGMGLVPENALGRRFRDAQGMLNRKLAERADLAVFVAAGLPIALKGQLP